MHLLIGCSSSLMGGSGISTYAKALCEAFFAMGVRTTIIAPPPFDFEQIGNTPELRYIPFKASEPQSKQAQELLKYIDSSEVTGIINNDNSLLQSIAPAVPCPFIAIGHANKTNIARLTCWQPHWTDHILVISDDMRARFTQQHKIPPTKCCVVYSGVPDRGWGINWNPKRQIHIVCASGSDYGKGSDLALATARRLQIKSGFRRTRITWCGHASGTLSNALKGLPDVHVAGRLGKPDFQAVLKTANILLFPSRGEGCPMVVLEALSYGVIPIASDAEGAMRSIINNGWNGFVCSLRHWPDEASSCVDFLFTYPDAAQQIRSQARASFVARFQDSATAQAILDLLARPTVDRRRLQTQIKVLRPHRVPLQAGEKPRILDRFCYRSGLMLRKESVLQV